MVIAVNLYYYSTINNYNAQTIYVSDGSRTLEREDIRAQDIRAQKHFMSSVLKYNKQKLLF